MRSVCEVPHCGELVHGRKLCLKHYGRWWREANPATRVRRTALKVPVSCGLGRVPLAGGRFALIDAEDVALVEPLVWSVAPSSDGCFYARAASNGRVVSMHRLILGLNPGDSHVDHRNGNGLDNRRSNLRLATRSQNRANSVSRHGSSRFKGVSWHKRGRRWVARIMVDGHSRSLGNFREEEPAARAYDQAALDAWGEYAHLNFPVEPAL